MVETKIKFEKSQLLLHDFVLFHQAIFEDFET